MTQEPTNPSSDDLDDLFLDPDEDTEEEAGTDDAGAGPTDAPGQGDERTAAEDAVLSLQAQLDEAVAEIESLKDRLLRKAADLENARRRHQREKDDLTRHASEGVLKEIVPVLDDLERAMAHFGQGGDETTIREGLEMVTRKFAQVMERRGVRAIEALHQPFDPQYHEAIQQRPDESVPHNTVVQEYQKGYLLHDRLLRPSLVVVAQGGPARPEAASEGDGDLREAGASADTPLVSEAVTDDDGTYEDAESGGGSDSDD